ncbi:MAG TPA: threonine synthase [Actinomycetota bacterium]|nr:threonine synthase [Actinomycetota bacterium]
MVWRGVIAEYRGRLPVTDATPVVTLGEGGTPLLRSETLSAETGLEVLLKFEGTNPTGSFKDRGMTVAVSRALERGVKAVVCASTGNTSASAAAYAARAGLHCAVLVPRGVVAAGKMAQTLVPGARVLDVEGSFDLALRITRELADSYPVELVNSVNPDRIEGQKTCAFEICDVLQRAPDAHVMPVGNAGNITSHWRGYREYRESAEIGSLPEIFGVQAEGADPIVRGEPVAEPSTVASAIRIGDPASWRGAVDAAAESGGEILSVRDEEILAAYDLVAAEGTFAEPASAASVAGLLRLRRTGRLERGQVAVCVLTGHGLKDPEIAMSRGAGPVPVEPDVGAVAAELRL